MTLVENDMKTNKNIIQVKKDKNMKEILENLQIETQEWKEKGIKNGIKNGK